MLADFIIEYLTRLAIPDGSVVSDGLFFLAELISLVMAYIPIHLILKPLLGEKIARYSFVAVLVAILIFIAGSVGVLVGV